jgi:hypothetical protein
MPTTTNNRHAYIRRYLLFRGRPGAGAFESYNVAVITYIGTVRTFRKS